MLAKAKAFLDSAPTPEARRARKQALYMYLYNAPIPELKVLEPKAFPRKVLK